MHRQGVRLADGRELIYYDAAPHARRSPTDERVLTESGEGPTLRLDLTTGEWISIAGHRNDRTFLPEADACPLCPSVEDRLTEIPSSDYEVAVFENRFPSFAGPPGATTGALFAERPASGRCEVVCFSSDHENSFVDLDVERVRLIIDVWADRTAELSAIDGVQQVFVFENRGEAIGVTLRHPHGQIYAYPYVTPRTSAQLAAAQRYQAETGGRHLFDDIVANELADGVRMVAETSDWLAFVPFAARWPVEIHLYPRQRTADLAELSAAQRDDLAAIYMDVLRRCDRLFGFPLPYVAGWHQAPVSDRRDLGALHLELFSVQRAPDKLKYLAASESAMGAFINDRTPEATAALLRAAGDA